MNEFRIGVSVASILPLGSTLAGSAFPTISAAVRELTEKAHGMWVNYAMGAALPNGRSVKNATGAYARSIATRQLNDMLGEVFTDLPYAEGIENGTRARDLHDMLGKSLKVRLTKDGRRYLIIPFRSYHSNSVIGRPMPAAIEGWWRTAVPREQSSHVTSMGWRASGTGAVAFRNRTTGRFRERRGEVVQVRQRAYKWGARLTEKDIRSLGLGDAAVKQFAGMVRFDKPGQPGRHSQFMNFRALVEGSPGWRVPARPGLHIAQTVAEQLRPIAEEAIRRAAEADVRRLLGQD